MPLLTKEPWSRYGWFSVWQVTETDEELQANLELTKLERIRLREIHHPKRRMEWLAMKNLLRAVMPELTIGYQPCGRPFSLFPGGNISFSHSRRWVAASFHPSLRAGIDLQVYVSKLLLIAPRFANDGELTFKNQLDARLWAMGLWVIKEALFKCYGHSISFSEQMWVGPFKGEEGETVAARVWVNGKVRHHIVKLRWFGETLCAMVVA